MQLVTRDVQLKTNGSMFRDILPTLEQAVQALPVSYRDASIGKLPVNFFDLFLVIFFIGIGIIIETGSIFYCEGR